MHSCNCRACGNAFDTDTTAKYCSLSCRKKGDVIKHERWLAKSGYKRAYTPKPPRPVVNHICNECGSDFESVAKTSMFCSSPCSSAHYRRLKHPAFTHTSCVDCTAELPYIFGKPRRRCTPCQGIYRRLTTPSSRAKARALQYGVQTEAVRPIEILESYEWKCNICHIDTPKQRRGTLYGNAPEIDHIIPLARGGTHTRDNLQLLCRDCNIEKSDSVIPRGGSTKYSEYAS